MKLLALIIIFVLVGCNLHNNKSTPKMVKINILKKQAIPIIDVSYGLLTYPELIFYHNEPHLIYAADFSFIYIVPVANPKNFKKIKVPNGEITGVFFINQDSIFIVYNPLGNLNNDYQLFLVDIDGNLKKKINILDKNNAKEIFILLGNSVMINNQYLFFDVKKSFNDPDSDIRSDSLSTLCFYNLLKDTFMLSKIIPCPKIPKHAVLDHAQNIYISESGKHNALVRYIYSPIFYELNLNNYGVNKYFLQSKIIDSIYAMNKFLNASFTSIYYNPYQKHYFHTCLPHLSMSDVYKPFFIITDDSMNYITETTETIFFNTIFGEKENIKVELKGDSIWLTYFEYTLETVDENTYKNYITTIKNDIQQKQNSISSLVCSISNTYKIDTTYDVMKLLQNYFHLTENKYSLLAMYGEMGCQSCNESLLKFFSKNFIYFKNNHVYLLLSASKQFYQNIVNTYDLKTYPYILLDTLKIYNYFNPSNEYIPRLIKVKDKKIIFDQFYNVDAFDSLESELLKVGIYKE